MIDIDNHPLLQVQAQKLITMNCPISPSRSTRSLNVSHISPYMHDRPFTFESQSQQVQQGEYKVQQGRDQDTDFSEERQHIEKEYKMRMDSLVKGYEVKISREQETFQLKQMKYIEQIQYLKRQVKELTAIHREGRTQSIDHHCSLCSNGQVVKFMKNMLQAVEQDHKGCINDKNAMTNTILSLEQKVVVYQHEHEEDEKRYQKLRQENKQLRIEKEAWQREKREKQREFREVERNFQVKEMGFEQETIKNRMMQKQLEDEIKKVQLKHLQSISAIKEETAKQFEEERKKIFVSQAQEKQLLREQPKQNRRAGKYKYEQLQINNQNANYGYQEQEFSYLPPRQLPLRPSLKSNYNVPNRLSYSKVKIEQSYTDYANNKRKTKIPERRSGLYQNRESLDTFRPLLYKK